ncbi:MAG: rhodanese-like domain-containing protein [Clostridia bacterium]|nr:rhodanese-like domain-containing protein [Clostridia bacterium]
MKARKWIGLILVAFILVLTAGCGNKTTGKEEQLSYMKKFFPESNEYNEENIKFHFGEEFKNGVMDQTILIDTRSPEEYEKGHICGAVNAVLDKEFAMKLLKDAPDDSHVLIYGNENDIENNKKFAELLRDIRWAGAYHFTVSYDELAKLDWMQQYIETEKHELEKCDFALDDEQVAKVEKYFE